ncbi:sugar ABC transporter ATP-binding protein [Paludisphaera borealis]|uniref:Arabinose import ATP-binding protein AraG n=1 Tax=Paludisphaera borealis TaxID=1387353 RepID=A0A1U7CW60_9BACT|nr:sugar ABC transporter ATP-binding protein [Paludisphaera borealis]APW63129.1 Arabinose import ATP-binding protein AraG [Paludisphaera borealis]
MRSNSSDGCRVSLNGLTRSFAGAQALKGVDLELIGGEVHALCGENGAGKSTLIQILGGAIRPDGGSISINGREVRFPNPAVAIEAGIAVIHQELSLVDAFSVAENLALGSEPRIGPWIDRRAILRLARERLETLGFPLDPAANVASLSVGQRQQVEIAKALGGEVRVLVLDEPTAALSRAETERLFDVLRSLRERGVAILYVSHHLEEVFEISDRITVLRDGRRIGTWPRSELSLDRVVAEMVGEAVDVRQRSARKTSGDPMLRVSGATGKTLRGVDLTVAPGEVVGLTGLSGAGQEELASALFGSARLASGEIVWKGRPFRPRHPIEASEQGVAMVPSDRRRQGLIPTQGITENVAIASYPALSRWGWINGRRRRALAARWCKTFEVAAASLSQKVLTLSGGNQQKVLLARWAARDPELLILNEPTRGIDVKTREAIHRWVDDQADAGRCVLLVSSDTQELTRLADRCVVLRAGRVARRLEPPDLSEHAIVAAMVES